MKTNTVERELRGARCPGFVQRRPFLMTYWLVAGNLVSERRWGLAPSVAILAIISAVAFMWMAGPFPVIRMPLAFVEMHAFWVGMLAGVLSAILVSRRRHGVSDSLRRSWLAPAPRADRTMRTSIVLATLWTPFKGWVTGLVVIGILTLMGGAGSLHLAIMFSAGVWVGSCGGFLPGGRRRRAGAPGSRYVPKRTAAADMLTQASLVGLSRWPVAEAFAWARPDTLRWPVMAALLSVMGGTPALAALSIVGQWMVLLYMAVLLWSTLRVSREAAVWLRATPVTVGNFAAAVGGRSLIHQFAAACASVALLCANTFPLAYAVSLVSLWLGFVLIAYSTGIAYSFNLRRGAGVSIAVAALVYAILVCLQRGVGVGFALVVSFWQYRQCVGYASGEKV